MRPSWRPRLPHGLSPGISTPSLARIYNQNALRVLYRLREGGYQAFLVGGCVRDLLVGIEPKDFDVATDALPEEIKKLFRNCRLIGRRFRLAHVFFGREIIEVATFRAATAPPQGEEPEPEPDIEDENAVEAAIEADIDTESEHEGAMGDDVRYREPVRRAPTPAAARERDDFDDSERVLDSAGRILRDNVYGTIDDDVWRRDFTANALYYNIADFSLWDYVGGFEDIAARRLRLIGDPETRYREDPVRMLRAARFEAKLGFKLDPATADPIEKLGGLLAQRAAGAPLRRNAQAVPHGPRRAESRSAAPPRTARAPLPTVDAYLNAHPGGLVEKLLLAGPAQHRCTRARRQARHADFLTRLALIRPDRRDHRSDAAGALARAAARSSTRAIKAVRAAAGAHDRFRADSRSACGKCSRCSRASSIRAAAARCA